jgi:hypothetical protein
MVALMTKPYTTTLNVSSCYTGTMLWFDHEGKICVALHPGYACDDKGWVEQVLDHRQWWGWNGYRGTWINGRLYIGNTKLQVVIGAGVRS